MKHMRPRRPHTQIQTDTCKNAPDCEATSIAKDTYLRQITALTANMG